MQFSYVEGLSAQYHILRQNESVAVCHTSPIIHLSYKSQDSRKEPRCARELRALSFGSIKLSLNTSTGFYFLMVSSQFNRLTLRFVAL